MATLSRGAGALVAAALLLAVSAVAWRSVTTGSPPAPALAGSTPTVAFPSAEPSFDLRLPLTVTEVSAGHRVTITGTGSRQVAFRVTDESMVAAHLDCRLCSGLLRVTAGERPEPLFVGTGPYEGEHLFAAGDARTGLLIVDAVGRWTLTLTSTAELAHASGAVSGEGPRVLVLGGPGTALVATAPGAGVRVSAYDPASRAALAAAPASRSGTRLGATLPAVVAVEGQGAWTLRPEG